MIFRIVSVLSRTLLVILVLPLILVGLWLSGVGLLIGASFMLAVVLGIISMLIIYGAIIYIGESNGADVLDKMINDIDTLINRSDKYTGV